MNHSLIVGRRVRVSPVMNRSPKTATPLSSILAIIIITNHPFSKLRACSRASQPSPDLSSILKHYESPPGSKLATKTVVPLYSWVIGAIDVDNLLYSPLEGFEPFDPCNAVHKDESALSPLEPPQAMKHMKWEGESRLRRNSGKGFVKRRSAKRAPTMPTASDGFPE